MLNHTAPGAAPRMRRWAPSVVAVALVIVVSACSSPTGPVVAGSGTLRTEFRDVGGFSTIELTGSGNVIIEQNGSESLSIEAEVNLLPDLTSDVSSGILRLGTRDGDRSRPHPPGHLPVTVEDLAGLQLSGSGSVTAAGITTPAISIDISGSGDVTIDGTADSQTVTISGSGNYNAGDLDTRRSTTEISGSGDVTVNALDTLEADISGSGSVTYSGSPHVSQDISGSGELRGHE